MAVRPSVPPDLPAIARRALALDPKDRWASASVMADALEATLAPGGGAGRGGGRRGGGRALAGATVGVRHRPAEPGPASPTARDAYVGVRDTTEPGAAPATRTVPLDRRRRRATTRARQPTASGSPVVRSPLLLAPRRSRSSSSSSRPVAAGRRSSRSPCPTSSGMTSTAAGQQAEALGLTLTPTGVVSSASPKARS